MEITINIKEKGKVASFLNLIKEMDYIEILNVNEDLEKLPIEHRKLLEKRLKNIENGVTKFKNWDMIKKKYEGKAF